MYESSDAASIAKSSRLHRYGSTERDNGLKRRDRMSNQFTWYEGRGIYEGRGTIWSETLKSPITGRFRVTWSDKGGCRIECFGTSLSLPQSLVILQDFSEFRDLEIQCEGAVFRAARCYRVNAVESANAESEQVDLSLMTLEAEYIVSPERPRFWAVSLVNFVAEILPFRDSAAPHPLRSGREPLDTDRTAPRWIPLSFNGDAAFIEQLPDYNQRVQALKDGTETVSTTAIFAGSIPNSAGVDIEATKDWLPTAATDALSLATGISVGVGLIELRDENGALNRRIHIPFQNKNFKPNHSFITDPAHARTSRSAVGMLAQNAIEGSAETKKRFRLLVSAIEEAQDAIETPDHAYTYIVRALDGMANIHSVNRTRLADSLPATCAQTTRQTLYEARDKLKKEERAYRQSGDTAVADILERIASRAEQADAIEDSFGVSLTKLLGIYDLRDEDAMRDFYSKSPRPDGRSWVQTLNRYRSGVIHRGYLNYGVEAEILDVLWYTRHLIDIAARIGMKEVAYAGTYDPFNLSATQQVDLDWIKNDVQVKQFGFNGMNPKPFKLIGFESIIGSA